MIGVETFVAPVSRFEILFGKTLGGATVAVIQGILVFLITLVAGSRPYDMAYLPLALLFLILIAILFSAVGVAIAARLDDMQGFPLIINFVIQPLFYLSGALFPLKGLPKFLEYITKVNPLSYGIDGMRYSLSGPTAASFTAGTSFIVLVAMIVVILLFSMYQFSRIEL